MLKILIAEKNDLYRSVLKNIFVQIPETFVAGSVSDGKEALKKVKEIDPDIITIDVDLPVINGITVLRHIRKNYPQVRAIMMSTGSRPNARIAMEALSHGAMDIVSLKDSRDIKQNFEHLQNDLTRIIKGYTKISGMAFVRTPVTGMIDLPEKNTASRGVKILPKIPDKPIILKSRIDIVVIGISTGGPPALHRIIPTVPSDFRVPVVIVQHMPESFTNILAESLNTKSRLKVVEAKTGDVPVPGTVYIAPGEKQLKFIKDRNSSKPVLITTDDPPENFCKPAADYLFRSVADLYGSRALGVIMTGMGGDGARGLKLMKAKGSAVIAQDEETCVVFGMPGEAVKLGVVDIVRPLDMIVPEIIRLVNKSWTDK